jgi:uncharacterized protein
MSGDLRQLPMFPLSTVLYPHAELPLHVFETRYRRLTADCLAGDGQFGVVLIERGSEVGGGDQRVPLGTIARLELASPLPDGRWVLFARGTTRISVSEWLPDDPYPQAMVEELADPFEATVDPAVVERAEQAVRRARALLSEMGRAPALPADLVLSGGTDATAWQLCAMAPVNPIDGQRLLQIDEPAARLMLLAELSEAVADDLSRLLGEGH